MFDRPAVTNRSAQLNAAVNICLRVVSLLFFLFLNKFLSELANYQTYYSYSKTVKVTILFVS